MNLSCTRRVNFIAQFFFRPLKLTELDAVCYLLPRFWVTILPAIIWRDEKCQSHPRRQPNSNLSNRKRKEDLVDQNSVVYFNRRGVLGIVVILYGVFLFCCRVRLFVGRFFYILFSPPCLDWEALWSYPGEYNINWVLSCDVRAIVRIWWQQCLAVPFLLFPLCIRYCGWWWWEPHAICPSIRQIDSRTRKDHISFFSYLFIFFHSVFFSSRDFSFSLEIGGGGIVGRTWQEFSVSSFLSCANQT